MAIMASPWKHPQSGIYYIRRKVPKALQGLPGLPKELYKRSLDTRDLAEAKALFAAAWAETEELFSLAQAQAKGHSPLTAKDAQQLASRWFRGELEHMEQLGGFEKYLVVIPISGDGESGEECWTLKRFYADQSRDAWSKCVSPFIADSLALHKLPTAPQDSPLHSQLVEAFTDHLHQLSELALVRRQGDWATQAKVLPQQPLSTEAIAQEKLPTLSELFQKYRQSKLVIEGDDRTTKKTLDEFSGVITQFIELYGDLPLGKINLARIHDYQLTLSKMPSSGNGIRSLTAPEQLAKAEMEGLPRISLATSRKRLKALSAVLGHGVNLGWLTENPVTATGLTKQLAKAVTKGAKSKRRKDYTGEELHRIFSSPIYRDGWKPAKADLGQALYWIPLLSAYTGARREELCQLFVSDVCKSPSGIDFLSILDSGDADDAGRTVKTDGSRRSVPIHSDLLALGFLTYVEGLPQEGQLFPGLTRSPDGWYGNNYGKHWAQYLEKVVQLDSPASPSHGFRHTFKTLCREVSIDTAVSDWITGHASPNIGATYGSNPLCRMAEEMKKFPRMALEANLLTD